VAVYARVSTSQQSKDQTIASQLEALRARVRQDGFSLTEEACFVDDGFSGSTLLRPALERLRDQVAAGVIERLYVLAPDRLARKLAHQAVLLEELQRAGVEVLFLNHVAGTSPEESLLVQMQGMIAEYERAKILERSRRGKLHAAKRGSINVLGGAPYGYRYVGRYEGSGAADYRIIEEHAQVVRQIFDWVGNERCSIKEVCRRLERQQIPSPKGKRRWASTTVWQMLKNPAYQGTAQFGKTCAGPWSPRQLHPKRGAAAQPRRPRTVKATPIEERIDIAVPAIVEPALFAAVAQQLAENRQRSRQRMAGARYLLQGLVICKECGHAYVGQGQNPRRARDYRYYRCVSANFKDRLCHNKSVRTILLEEQVWQDVCALLADPDRVRQEYERRRIDRLREDQCQRLQQRVDKTKKEMGRLLDAYQTGLVEREDFESRFRRAKERLQVLQGELDAAAAEVHRERQWQEFHNNFQHFAHEISRGLSHASWHTKREVIRALIKVIEIDDDQIRIVYKVTLPNQTRQSDFFQHHSWAGHADLRPEADQERRCDWKNSRWLDPIERICLDNWCRKWAKGW
jgi:site-specific DNA recombinase